MPLLILQRTKNLLGGLTVIPKDSAVIYTVRVTEKSLLCVSILQLSEGAFLICLAKSFSFSPRQRAQVRPAHTVENG
jgi:hypothetical protein